MPVKRPLTKTPVGMFGEASITNQINQLNLNRLNNEKKKKRNERWVSNKML